MPVAARLDLSPADAVAFFKAKGEAISWDWHEVLGQQNSEVFTVAKATSLDVLRAIREQVDLAVGPGQTFEEFKKALRPKLQDLGWWGRQEVLDAETGEVKSVQLGSDRRLRTIFQTNVQTSYMAGRFTRLVGNTDDRPYWQYVAIMDGRTRPAHAALHGRVFRWDDPIWKVIFPPNGWGCRCRARALTADEVKAKGLTVENGADRIVTKEVQLGKDGPTVTVQGLKGAGLNGKDVFWPDPGWDYNPGETPSRARTLTQSMADKVTKVPASIGAKAAAELLADAGAARLLDDAWQGWVQDVQSDPAIRGRSGVLGYVREHDLAAAASRGVQVGTAVMSVNDATLLSRSRAGTLSGTQWPGLSELLRKPQAVLWDKGQRTLIYVLPDAQLGQASRIVVSPNLAAAKSAADATVKSANLATLADLQAALKAGDLELLEGEL